MVYLGPNYVLISPNVYIYIFFGLPFWLDHGESTIEEEAINFLWQGPSAQNKTMTSKSQQGLSSINNQSFAESLFAMQK